MITKEIMKGKRVLPLIALVAMSLVACGSGNKSNPASQPGSEPASEPVSQSSATSQGQSSQQSSSKPSVHSHKWSDWNVTKEATCLEEGSRERSCECGEKQTEVIAKLAHKFVASNVAYPQKDGYAQTSVYECEMCHSTALQFAATDMNEELSLAACGLTAKDSTIYSEINNSGSHAGSIRLRKAENDGGTEAYGTHAIYKVNLAEGAENADLEFEIDPKSGYDVPIFDYVDGDAQQGYRKIDGELKLTTKRYGLKVNGVEVELGPDNYGAVNGGSHLWYSWNVKMNLVKGENIIDVYCLGGYRAYIYNFRLTGLPAYEAPEAPASYLAKIGETAAGEGFIKTETMADVYNSGRTALKWSAMDYKADESNLSASTDYVRFADGGLVENKNGEEGAGSHIVYYVKSPAAVAKAGLAFRIENTGGNSGKAGIFDQIPNDSAQGYVKKADGTFEVAEKRYGLRVNDVEYFLEDDEYGDQASAKGWFDWPVRFPVKEGINKIDIFAYHGYRAKLYEFELTNLPAVEGSKFTLSDAFESDDVGHWKTAAGQDGVKFMYEEHTFEADAEHPDVAATCTEDGSHTVKCAVCGKVVAQVLKAEGHSMVQGTAVKNSDDKDVFPISCSKGDATGFEMNLRDCGDPSKIANDGKVTNGSKLQWKFKGLKVGVYEFYACAKLGSGENPFNTGYGLKAGETVGEATISGKKLSDFGATNAQSVYFPVGTVTVKASDIDANGETLVEYSFPSSQNYRHCYENTVRLIYVGEAPMEQPVGAFHGLAKTAAGTFIPVDLTLADNAASLDINGASAGVTACKWDGKTGKLELTAAEAYGTISAVYDAEKNTFGSFACTGAAAATLDATYAVALSGNCQFLDCSSMTTDSANNVFIRRYDRNDGNGWQINKQSDNRLMVATAAERTGVQCNGFSTGKVGFTLKADFETPIPGTVVKSIGCWIYNPGESAFSIKVFAYKSANRASNGQLNTFTVQPGWNFYQTGVVNGSSFTANDSLYNIQFYYENLSVNPIFDDLCIYM